MCHVVDAVQVALTSLVIHVLTFGFYYLYGVMAKEDLARRPAEKTGDTNSRISLNH